MLGAFGFLFRLFINREQAIRFFSSLKNIDFRTYRKFVNSFVHFLNKQLFSKSLLGKIVCSKKLQLFKNLFQKNLSFSKKTIIFEVCLNDFILFILVFFRSFYHFSERSKSIVHRTFLISKRQYCLRTICFVHKNSICYKNDANF